MPQDLGASAPQDSFDWTKGFRNAQLKPLKPFQDPPIDETHLRPIPLRRQPTWGHGEVDDESEAEEEEDDEDTMTPEDSDKQRRLQEITRKHREICDQCGKRKVGMDNLEQYMGGPEAFSQFLAQFGDVLEAVGEKQETLLHHFARLGKGQLLVQHLVRNYPYLVQLADQDGNTAPLIAVEGGQRPKFIKVILKSKQAIPALRQKWGNGTLLHKIFQFMLPVVKNVQQALSSVSDAPQRREIFLDLFICKDNKGQTPLHVAIHTIARSNSGINTDFLPNVTALITKAVEEIPDALNKTDDSGRTPLHIALKTIGDSDHENPPANIRELIRWLQTMITHRPNSFYERTHDGRRPYTLLGAAKRNTMASNLMEDMKRLYMRQFPVEELKEILYGARDPGMHPHDAGPGVEKTIFFDLSNNTETSLDHNYLKKLENHVQFESILHHVDLPCMTVRGGENLLGPLQSEHADSQLAPCLQRRVDFVKIFKWLRNRGVKEIIDVSVVDDSDSPHCEEAIELALRGFAVEVLNWSRFDMPSDAVFNAAPGVRELYLYSSGNNEVLRGWSADGGINRLSKLRKVHLSVQQGVISEARIQGYISQFRERLYHLRKDITVDDKIMAHRSSPQLPLHSQPSTNSRKHAWLDTMDQFAGVVRSHHKHLAKYAPTVKVAVIDDGVDSFHATLQGNIEGGTSFHYRPGRDDRPIDYWSAPGGHGTEMAKLICRICPMARLYVVRLGEGQVENGVRQIKVDTAIKAIKWATSVGVNIISMSWSISRKGINDEQKCDEFDRCVRAAYAKGITMFCAAGDHGNTSESRSGDDVPAAFNDPLKIGAATVHGSKWPQIGAQKLDFYLPGENLPLVPPSGQGPQQPLLSGSSLATAVAAGLAALLQYCMGIAARKRKSEPVFRTDDMKHAFQELGKTDPEIPEVQQYFGNTAKLDKADRVAERYEYIADHLQKTQRSPGG